MVTVKIMLADEVRELQVESGKRVVEALREAGVDAPTPCGGNGKCGKCRVRAAGGLEPAPDGDGACLACVTRIVGDAVVWPGEVKSISAIEGMGVLPEMELDPATGGYGLAVDIGTTTLAAQLVSLEDGALLSAITSENPQRVIAHDVIGRIQASMEGKGALLRDQITAELLRMEHALCARQGISPEAISKRVVTGNTTMLYLLTGRSPVSLAAAPFDADCLYGFEEEGRYLPPCFGAYVGGDISCTLLASGMMEKHRTAMLIDIGTNGEIALLHGGKLYCCATAAGPAFEGVGISSGVSSVQGAIESAWPEDGKIAVSTIGGGEAVGVCGSGLIDAVAAMLELEWLDETGFLEDEEVELAPGVSLEQKDIRMIQLAKGSICAGMRSLMAMAGVEEGDVEALYIAGGFGRHIKVENAIRIGLIPAFPRERIHVIGNASLAGSVMLLLNRGMSARIDGYISVAECVNLAKLPMFQTLYPEEMMFPTE